MVKSKPGISPFKDNKNIKFKLIKSCFCEEDATKKSLAKFIEKADKLSMGSECQKFERRFSKKQERKYSVFVNSGSSANLLLLQSLLSSGVLKRGDKIGFSAVTWSTNVMPLIQLGFKLIPIDCNLLTLNISPIELEKKISSLKGLFLTNVLGFSDNIDRIKKLCYKHGTILLEDNCESLGSKVGGRLLGNFGMASTFSFFVGHHLSTIEGGMVCTDDKELYEKLIISRAHGWDRNLSSKQQIKLRSGEKIDEFYAKYCFYDLAYNFRPTEINGFLGCKQLEYWDFIVRSRENNFNYFKKIVDSNDNLIHFQLQHMDIISNFAIPVICKNKETFETYKEKFEKNGVEIRPIIAGNITRQPFYKKYVGACKDCPNADRIHENGFYFCNNPELTSKERNFLGSLLES